MQQQFSYFRRLCLLGLFLAGVIPAAISQVFTATMVSTPTHKSCYSGSLTVSYTATVIPPPRTLPWTIDGSNTTFKLRTTASGAGGAVLLSNTNGTINGANISGSFNLSAASLQPDVYTIYASITVVVNGTPQVVQTTSTFVVGFQASWTSLLDMQALPTIYSAKRSTTTSGVTTARAISSNKLAANTNGWIDLGAQFGGSTGSVIFVIGKTTTSITNPLAQATYFISFQRTGATTGTVTVTTNTSSTILSGMSFDSRILMRRTSGAIRFYNGATGTLISGAPTINYTGELNVGGFADNLNDGPSNITTSFNCVFENQYFYLKDETEQSVAYISSADDKLRIKYEEEYFDAAGTLNYRIISLTNDAVPATVTISKPAHTNWIEIPLGVGGVAFTSGHVYLLEVTDTKGRKQYLKYKKL